MRVRKAAIGGLAGYVASRAMDLATAWFYEHQGDESKAREAAACPEGVPVEAVSKITALFGVSVGEKRAQVLGMRAHRALGITYGAIAGLSTGTGADARPIRVGVWTGIAAFVLVDEALNAVLLDPSPFDFPVDAHLRGLFGHLTFGAALGAVLCAAQPILAQPRTPL